MTDNLSGQTDIDPLPRRQPVLLLLLDGWGVAPAGEANAISLAKTPIFSRLLRDYPAATLAAKNKDINARYLFLGAGRETGVSPTAAFYGLSSVVSQAGKRQIKIAETERFAALMNFFNGGAEDKLPGEEWKIISSAGRDHTVKLPLALRRTAQEVIKAIENEADFSLIVATMPILDLTAATGDFAAARRAAESLDKSLADILAAIEARGGVAIISAAGGNAEKMRNLATELPDTEMTNNPVPLIIFGFAFKGKTIGLADAVGNDLSLVAPAGSLADVAPTVLKIMGLAQPAGMTGKSLIN